MTDILVTIDGNTGITASGSSADIIIQSDDFSPIKTVDVEIPGPISVISIIDQGPMGPPGADSTVPGPTGPAGPQGVQGPTGVAGADGYSLTFMWDQNAPSDLWDILHTLHKYPSVTIIDSANNAVYGKISYISDTRLTVAFNGSFSGRAYLN